MRVRIIKRPEGTVDGASLKSYVPGEIYDVQATLADYLVLNGFAVAEMRATSKRVSAVKKEDRRNEPFDPMFDDPEEKTSRRR